MLARSRHDRRRRNRAAAARRPQLQSLEDRRLLAAAPLGATWKDTGEYLLGTVAVSTVLLESNGAIDPQSQNWEPAEIQPIVDKVVEGVTWWSDLLDTLGTVHELDFVFDHSYAYQPFETSYEPIDRRSQDHDRYVGEFLAAQGYAGELNLENAMWRFNHAQRERLDADWAFTIFIVDASDDSDGLFAPGGFPAAFALPGGLYTVVPSGRAASTIAHEMGHIFWAFDEYENGASYTARRGYYDTQNLNAFEDRPDSAGPQQNSIMWSGVPLARAYGEFGDPPTSPAATLALVGWRDSDSDGVFDVLDVPLELDAIGHFDPQSETYRLSGSATAVALHNRNSYGEHPSVIGTNSDITLNRIDEIQYRLDGGTWVTAATLGQQTVEFDVSVAINQAFSNIDWRAIDLATGITSELVSGTPTLPAIASDRHRGIAFVDADGNGFRDANEAPLAGTRVTIRRSDGSPLPRDVIDAADLEGSVTGLDGVTLTVESSAAGPPLDSDLRSLVSSDAGGRRVFHAQELSGDGTPAATRERWAERRFVAHFDHPVGEVTVDVYGLNEMTYGRLEAYDSNGNLLSRTTEMIGQGQWTTLSVDDPRGSIATIRAFGLDHSDTGIAISRLEYGFTDRTTTDAHGVWTIANLPDGLYQAEIVPERLIHQFDQPLVTLVVSGGTSDFQVLAADRVDSPRHNPALPHDANQDGSITAVDALVIINDLARYNTRVLTGEQSDGFDIDVNNDGAATALDALLVINYLGRVPLAGEPEAVAAVAESPATPGLKVDRLPGDRVLAQWPADTKDRTDTFLTEAEVNLWSDWAADADRAEEESETEFEAHQHSAGGTSAGPARALTSVFPGQSSKEPSADALSAQSLTLNAPRIFRSIRPEISEPLERQGI